MNVSKITLSIFSAIFLHGCATPPHTFKSAYSPEALPDVGPISGIHSISGSSFLRQNGGGIVTCAGNSVSIEKTFSFERNAYASEYIALSYESQKSSVIDPRLIDFQKKLHLLKQKNTIKTVCDVDGKFRIENISAGTYRVLSKVFWVVGGQPQGGIVFSNMEIPENKNPTTKSIVVDKILYHCYSVDCDV